MGCRVEVNATDLALNATIDGHTHGAWRNLFESAMRLIDDVEARVGSPMFWTLGGGTVLMLRHQHRHSKDIDIFVSDPQLLGYFSPRLSEVAERLTGQLPRDGRKPAFTMAPGAGRCTPFSRRPIVIEPKQVLSLARALMANGNPRTRAAFTNSEVNKIV